MGPIRKRESQAKAAQAQAEAARAQAAEQAAAEAEVAKEQDAAIAGALREDEAHRQADLEEVAVEEAEAVPDWPPECCQRHEDSPNRRKWHAG